MAKPVETIGGHRDNERAEYQISVVPVLRLATSYNRNARDAMRIRTCLTALYLGHGHWSSFDSPSSLGGPYKSEAQVQSPQAEQVRNTEAAQKRLQGSMLR